MDALQQLPTYGDGLLGMRELARTPLEDELHQFFNATLSYLHDY